MKNIKYKDIMYWAVIGVLSSKLMIATQSIDDIEDKLEDSMKAKQHAMDMMYDEYLKHKYTLNSKITELSKENNKLVKDLESKNVEIGSLHNKLQSKNMDCGSRSKGNGMREVGTFQITGYTLDPSECGWEVGHKNYGVTSSGKKAVAGVTVAADWKVLPKGTTIYIEGIGKRVVQDTGSAVKGNIIDVFTGDPQIDKNAITKAKNIGRQSRKVWVVE